MTSGRIVAFAARAWNFLTILVFVGIAALLASGYRATRDWQQGVATRIAHQTEESADLIIKAIGRDMRGAQAMILANRDWDAPVPADTADLDITEQVATIFCPIPIPRIIFFMARRKPRHHLFQPKHPPAALDASTKPSDRLSDLSRSRSAHR